MRVGAQNPPAPSKADRNRKLAVAAALARVKSRQRSSRSSSESSSSNSSDSESSESSSSSSRETSPPRREALKVAFALQAKASIDALKSGSEKRQIKLNLKNPVGGTRKEPQEPVPKKSTEVPGGKKRPASSPPPLDKGGSNKKATSRREELLKQLKAVEDAIAKKRSKVN